MIRDPNKGIAIDFDYNNRPYKVTWDNGNTIEWLYDGNGAKLQQLVKRNGVEIGKIDYIGDGIEYESDTLATIYLNDAKATFSKGIFEGYSYFIQDHLMSSRVVFKDDGNGIASIVSEHHTYPFGFAFEGNFVKNASTKRLYNFKEKVGDFGLGWMDFGKRWYIGGDVPVFLGVDPIANQIPSLSPYNYGSLNPVKNIDLYGLQGVESNDLGNFVNDVKKNGFTNTVKSYFNFGSLISGTENEKTQTVTRLHQTANKTEIVKERLKEATYDSVEKTAKFVRSKADETQIAALTITGLSGGATSPVTGPIAAGAEVVSNTALGVEVAVDVARDGILNQSIDELLFKAIGISGKNIMSETIDDLNITGHKAEQTIEAVKSIGAATNKTVIKSVKNKIDE